MILIWFNNNTGQFYTKFYKNYILCDYYVGYKNSYGHEVIQILIISNNKFYNVYNYNDYIKKTSYSYKKNKLLTFFRKLIYTPRI